MNRDDAKTRLFDRVVTMQGEINDLAADYFASTAGPDPRVQEIGRLLIELRQARALLLAAGQAAPELLTSEADEISAALERHGYFKRETPPPADCSTN